MLSAHNEDTSLMDCGHRLLNLPFWQVKFPSGTCADCCGQLDSFSAFPRRPAPGDGYMTGNLLLSNHHLRLWILIILTFSHLSFFGLDAKVRPECL